MAQKSITSFFKPLSTSTDNSPKRKAGPLEKGSKRAKGQEEPRDEAFVEGVRKQAALTSALSENIGLSWFHVLEPEFSKDYFSKLSAFLEKERQEASVYPPPKNVFTWTQMCELREVKVVILGQDPYHGPNQAHGLAFSVSKGVALPPSLRNMFQEIESDDSSFKPPGHGDLTGWAKQGVLLLNACLTVRAHNANSHSNKGWEEFTDAVIEALNSQLLGLVFLLWGSYAQKKGIRIDPKKHLVLKSPHPSPLSASRGFFGCKHFSKANKYLHEQGKAEIDWKHLP